MARENKILKDKYTKEEIMRGIKTTVTKSNNSCVCQKRDLFLFSKFKTFINMKLMVTFISFSTTVIAPYFHNSSIDFHVRIRGFRSFLLLKPRVDSDNLIDESTSKSLNEMHFPLALLYVFFLRPLFFSTFPRCQVK